jgi:type I restriction enzyme S subunit
MNQEIKKSCNQVNLVKSRFRQLGNYIQQVNKRNTDLQDLPLIGLSISKEFIPSIANTIGTDMSSYRVIERNNFAYCGVTSRNGEKITIALFNNYDKALVSQAYTPFKIIDTENLLPEYLMMWFRRPEFDRYARFKSHGSVREIFDWQELCETLIPIPQITRQRELVAEYSVVQNRINQNNALITRLEQTAQAIYKEWFVDGVDKENLPDGWRVDSLSNIATFLNGLAMQNYPAKNENDFIPILKIRELSQGYFDENSDKGTLNTPKEFIIENGDVIFSWSGTLRVEIWSGGKGALNQHLFKVFSEKFPKWYYYLWSKFHLDEFIRIADGKATSLGHIKREHLDEAKVVVPNSFENMNKTMKPFFDLIISKKIESQKLEQLKGLLLSRMSNCDLCD